MSDFDSEEIVLGREELQQQVFEDLFAALQLTTAAPFDDFEDGVLMICIARRPPAAQTAGAPKRGRRRKPLGDPLLMVSYDVSEEGVVTRTLRNVRESEADDPLPQKYEFGAVNYPDLDATMAEFLRFCRERLMRAREELRRDRADRRRSGRK